MLPSWRGIRGALLQAWTEPSSTGQVMHAARGAHRARTGRKAAAPSVKTPARRGATQRGKLCNRLIVSHQRTSFGKSPLACTSHPERGDWRRHGRDRWRFS